MSSQRASSLIQQSTTTAKTCRPNRGRSSGHAQRRCRFEAKAAPPASGESSSPPCDRRGRRPAVESHGKGEVRSSSRSVAPAVPEHRRAVKALAASRSAALLQQPALVVASATVSRAQSGTSASAWPGDDPVPVRCVASSDAAGSEMELPVASNLAQGPSWLSCCWIAVCHPRHPSCRSTRSTSASRVCAGTHTRA